ncbi:MAG: RNA polymerase sigma factor [bacterium]
MRGTNNGADVRNALSDNELAEKARSDRSAFAELYERFFDKVYTYVFYRVGRRAAAEDIVADTFLRALQHIGSFRARGGGFGAWLLRIARNRMIDYGRREKRLLPLSQVVPDTAASPEEAAINAETGENLRRLVAALPEEQSEAVILKYAVGLKNREIAKILGKSETAVSSLLHRALGKLREGVGQ